MLSHVRVPRRVSFGPDTDPAGFPRPSVFLSSLCSCPLPLSTVSGSSLAPGDISSSLVAFRAKGTIYVTICPQARVVAESTAAISVSVISITELLIPITAQPPSLLRNLGGDGTGGHIEATGILPALAFSQLSFLLVSLSTMF